MRLRDLDAAYQDWWEAERIIQQALAVEPPFPDASLLAAALTGRSDRLERLLATLALYLDRHVDEEV